MHVYVRDEPVRLRMAAADHDGLLPDGSELVPLAFFAEENEQPSFRALLPPDTVEVLRDALRNPVTVGVLAEEPEETGDEIHAMVGLAVPVNENRLSESSEGQEGGEDNEPWRASIGSSDAWRGDDYEDSEPVTRTALLAFAPLVRLRRRFPEDFGEELADLLESALSGSTKPVLEARVDEMLGGG